MSASNQLVRAWLVDWLAAMAASEEQTRNEKDGYVALFVFFFAIFSYCHWFDKTTTFDIVCISLLSFFLERTTQAQSVTI